MDAIAKNPKLKETAINAASDADKNVVTPLFQFVNVGYPVKYNWNTQRTNAGKINTAKEGNIHLKGSIVLSLLRVFVQRRNGYCSFR